MRHLALLIAVIFMALMPYVAHADNSREAEWTVGCSFTYAGEQHTYGLYDITKGQGRATSLESRLQYFALMDMAAEHFQEYPNWLDYPKSVQPSDLKGWHCQWWRGYHELP